MTYVIHVPRWVWPLLLGMLIAGPIGYLVGKWKAIFHTARNIYR